MRSKPSHAASPAFNALELTAYPRTDWIRNGGNVFNQRYSPLTLLDRDNPGTMGGANWPPSSCDP